MNALEFRHRIEYEGKIKACRLIKPDCETEQQADVVIMGYLHTLFAHRKLAAAGVLCWGETLFNPRPIAVRMVWNAISKYHKVIIIGGGSVSKSYTGMAWNELNWWSDPEYTTVKLISTTGGHAKGNTYSTIKNLHKQAIVQMPGVVRAESLAFTESDQRACIAIVKIREGADNSGVMQGFHPLPRPKAHPVYGPSSRVVAVLDEAEEIAGGIWGGVDNMLTAVDDTGSVKVMAFLNPKDITRKVAQLAEPPGGWSQVDIESGYRGKNEWKSKSGWHVVRIDPKYTENVQQRKIVFPGFHTFEGYRTLEAERGGNSLRFFTFGRGIYPPEGADSTIVSQSILNRMKGEFLFTGPTIRVAGADIAVDGRDEAIYCVGRLGKASAFKPAGSNELIRFPEERTVAQLDQMFALKKGSTAIVAAEVKKNSIKLQVAPEWVMIDRTGNGGSIHDLLCVPEYWSEQVRGIDFTKPATSNKIFAEDREPPSELYEGIVTEVWFAVARWGEFGYLAISPNVRSEELDRQLIGRRYKQGAGKKLAVEKKDEYKLRIGRSPDHADGFTIFVHAARTGGVVLASMTGRKDNYSREEATHGEVDEVQWHIPENESGSWGVTSI